MPQSKPDHKQDFERSNSGSPNARPRDETIGQTAGGEPDGSSKAVEISPEEEQRITDIILDR